MAVDWTKPRSEHYAHELFKGVYIEPLRPPHEEVKEKPIRVEDENAPEIAPECPQNAFEGIIPVTPPAKPSSFAVDDSWHILGKK